MHGGQRFLAHALELAARLPRTLAEVRSGRVPVWRAMRIAEETLPLTPEGAGFVDAQVGPFAARVSWAQLDRLIAEAIARHCPDLARQVARRAADQRDVVIDTRQISFTGTAHLTGDLDLADALDLDHALSTGARALQEPGPVLRRVLGRARRIQEARTGPLGSTREVVLIAHLNAPTSEDPEALAVFLENTKSLITRDQLAAWCGPATKITLKPVIDLRDRLTTSGYAIPDRISEHTDLRDRHCRFPHCERLARHCDTDHIRAYDHHGPPDQTNTDNLARLCRRHHRLKTHGDWTYTTLEPGTHLWRSPLGLTYLVDATGTRDLTPRPVHPPGGGTSR